MVEYPKNDYRACEQIYKLRATRQLQPHTALAATRQRAQIAHPSFCWLSWMTESGEITALLRDWRAGNPAAIEHLFELVYPQLRQIAGALFRGERPENLLQPTSVVNELFLKLIRQRSLRFEDREHFYSLSARLMRRVLVDHARSEGRQKRDGGVLVPLDADMAWIKARPAEMIDLDRVLAELEQLDARKCRMVELRFFLGFTADETAELLNTSKATVDRELRFVRGWLHDRLHST